MPTDATKKFYPESMCYSREQIAKRILHMTTTSLIPNFGQVGIGAANLIEVMGETMVQEFVDQLGEMYKEQHDYESLDAWKRIYEYRWARLAEQLVDEVHHRGGPG